MTFDIYLQRNVDKEVVKLTEEVTWEENEFIWTEGNYACDCNRFLFFERANGREPENQGDSKCGCTDYSIIKVIQNDEIVYTEEPR